MVAQVHILLPAQGTRAGPSPTTSRAMQEVEITADTAASLCRATVMLRWRRHRSSLATGCARGEQAFSADASFSATST